MLLIDIPEREEAPFHKIMLNRSNMALLKRYHPTKSIILMGAEKKRVTVTIIIRIDRVTDIRSIIIPRDPIPFKSTLRKLKFGDIDSNTVLSICKKIAAINIFIPLKFFMKYL